MRLPVSNNYQNYLVGTVNDTPFYCKLSHLILQLYGRRNIAINPKHIQEICKVTKMNFLLPGKENVK